MQLRPWTGITYSGSSFAASHLDSMDKCSKEKRAQDKHTDSWGGGNEHEARGKLKDIRVQLKEIGGTLKEIRGNLKDII